MLNRRSLRIKAMQTLYAFFQCKKSDYHVAMDLINEKLTPGFEVLEKPPQSVIEGNKRKAIAFFRDNFDKDLKSIPIDEKNQAGEAAIEGIEFYCQQVKKDFDFFAKSMIGELEKIEWIYLSLLLLIKEFSWQSQQDDVKQDQKFLKKKTTLLGKALSKNQLVQRLAANETLEKEASKRRINWGKYNSKIEEWYFEIIKKDETIRKYAELETPNMEDDKKLLNYFFKSIIFKDERFENHFEEMGVRWLEDKEIIKGMINKTIKVLSEEDNKDYKLELFSQQEDWDEERGFFINLFKYTVEKENELEEIISVKTKNWDIERIALLDKIILKMALTEMIIFPGIPVKVTINEYLEISKRYSTPKSRQFVNGLLDTISDELLNKAVIKKSGRGLIDNK